MAQVDYFLKIDGIEGESEDDKHGKEIDVLAWSWGESNAGSSAYGGGGGAGKVQMNDFSFQMHVNKASPKLLLACASGQHIASAVLTCRKAGKEQQEYIIIKFKDLLIASFDTGGNAGDTVPVDSITFNFSNIEYEYYPQTAKGTLGPKIPVKWDLKKNTGG